MGREIHKQIILKQLGAKIAYYRTLRELNQEGLANRISVSKSVISKIERGRYNIAVTTLLDIADALNIEACLLLTFDAAEKSIWWESYGDGKG